MGRGSANPNREKTSAASDLAEALRVGVRGPLDMFAGALRGSVTSKAGQFGDAEEVVRDYFGSKGARFLPTTEELSDYLPPLEKGKAPGSAELLGRNVDVSKSLSTALRKGPKAKIFTKADPDSGDVKRAIELLRRGGSPETNEWNAWGQTGRMPVPLGRGQIDPEELPNVPWKQEVMDRGSEINPKVRLAGADPYTLIKPGEYELKDVLTHPYLWVKEPELAKSLTKVWGPKDTLPERAKNSLAWFDPNNSSINLNNRMFGKQDPSGPRSALLHEMQHRLQKMNAWPNGSNRRVSKFTQDMQDELLEQYKIEMLGQRRPERLAMYERMLPHKGDSDWLYMNTLGEQQARAVQMRRDLPEANLRALHPALFGYDDAAGGYDIRQLQGALNEIDDRQLFTHAFKP